MKQVSFRCCVLVQHKRILAHSSKHYLNADDDKEGLLWVRCDLPPAHFQKSQSFAKSSILKKNWDIIFKAFRREKAVFERGKLRSAEKEERNPLAAELSACVWTDLMLLGEEEHL